MQDSMSQGAPATALELPNELTAPYTETRILPDGRICGVFQLMFHWTMHVGIDWVGYQDRYCYANEELAVASMNAWDGQGDPVGWHRHPSSGRRRDLATGAEWIEW